MSPVQSVTYVSGMTRVLYPSEYRPNAVINIGVNWLPDTYTHQTTFKDEFRFRVKRTAHGEKKLEPKYPATAQHRCLGPK